jgi:hypothetical protein
MAEPTLPSFPFRPRIKEQSAEALHFVAAFDAKRGLYRFVCECQPMATVTSQAPKRCPFCGQQDPVRVEGSKFKEKI